MLSFRSQRLQGRKIGHMVVGGKQPAGGGEGKGNDGASKQDGNTHRNTSCGVRQAAEPTLRGR